MRIIGEYPTEDMAVSEAMVWMKVTIDQMSPRQTVTPVISWWRHIPVASLIAPALNPPRPEGGATVVLAIEGQVVLCVVIARVDPPVGPPMYHLLVADAVT